MNKFLAVAAAAKHNNKKWFLRIGIQGTSEIRRIEDE